MRISWALTGVIVGGTCWALAAYIGSTFLAVYKTVRLAAADMAAIFYAVCWDVRTNPARMEGQAGAALQNCLQDGRIEQYLEALRHEPQFMARIREGKAHCLRWMLGLVVAGALSIIATFLSLALV